jgi:hypothetical protein
VDIFVKEHAINALKGLFIQNAQLYVEEFLHVAIFVNKIALLCVYVMKIVLMNALIINA